MPVQRDYDFPDGSKVTEVDPEYERKFREFILEKNPAPKWNEDPTYNLRRKPKC